MRRILGKISKQLPFIMLVMALVCLGSVALAQQPPDKNDPNNPPPDPQPAMGQPLPGGQQLIVVNGGGGQMQGRIRFGGGPMMMGDALGQFVNMLGAINLKTEFTLTADQKTKIQAIRDDFKQQMEKWRAEHADELKQMDEQQQEVMNNLQQGNPPDPNQMMEMEQQRKQLMDTAPNGEDHVEQIKALFTGDQAKIFEAKKVEIEQEREAMMQRMGGPRIFPGGMMMGGPPPGGQGGAGAPADPDKKK